MRALRQSEKNIKNFSKTTLTKRDFRANQVRDIRPITERDRLERKADMFSKRTIKQHTAVTSVDTASEK